MQQLDESGTATGPDSKSGMVMKKETVRDQYAASESRSFSGLYVVAGVAVLFVGLLVLVRYRRRRDQDAA